MLIGLTDECCVSEIRQTSQEERDQRLLASLEVEDLGKDAESTEATPLRRYLMVEALLQPGFKWWAGVQTSSMSSYIALEQDFGFSWLQ